MDLTGISHPAGAAAAAGVRSSEGAFTSGSAASSVPSSDASFSATLATQQQLDAARDVLATLPAPIVYALRDYAGPAVDSVDRLFGVFKDGSFTLPDNYLGRPGTIMHATAHAATVFETPTQMWAAMRAAVFDPASVASVFLSASPAPTTPPITASTTAFSTVGAAPAPRVASEVRSLEDAARVLNTVRSTGPRSTTLDWWDAALRFLLGSKFPA
jgi:hypothetical protein